MSEVIRGCGWRKLGGLYLVGEGISIICGRLPFPLKLCPTCGSGIKFSRGFTWVAWKNYAGNCEVEHHHCHDHNCPICFPKTEQVMRDDKTTVFEPAHYGLLWVGEKFYTPESFSIEASKLGVSKRIATIPKKLQLGKTWVLLAHKNAVTDFAKVRELVEKSKSPDELDKLMKEQKSDIFSPGIFHAFCPQRVEMLIKKSDLTDEKKEELAKRGITPVEVPDDWEKTRETPLLEE